MAMNSDPRRQSLALEPTLSVWRQPRSHDGTYVQVERRELAALTSLRFFAALYVVIHHLVNVGLLHSQGAGADRAATWYLAWATQGHIGVTFFFVLSGFILAWCYHQAFADLRNKSTSFSTRNRFWRARFARVWPLHAVMFLVFVPLAFLDAERSVFGLLTLFWQGIMNLFLLHAWIPFGGVDGLSDTFNAPSWTLSVEAFFYLMFPALMVLLARRLRWGVAQLALLAVGAWLVLGFCGVILGDSVLAEWTMRVFPVARFVDFLIGVSLGLIVVQRTQRRAILGRDQRFSSSSFVWTHVEAVVLIAAAISPLLWSEVFSGLLPGTLGTSWFHLPVMCAAILVLSLERGRVSRSVLAWRPLVWLGEVSYALYLVHLFIVLTALRIGLYDLLGVWVTSFVLIIISILVSGVVHERFEKPMRARLVRK